MAKQSLTSSQYNFVLSASLSAAIAVAAIVMFFALQWKGLSVDWWGNTVSFQGCEAEACTLRKLADGEIFGPEIGTWSA